MDAWGGVRPAKFYTGMRSPLADPDGIDFVVIRENSEGIYPGREGDLADAKRLLPHVRDRFGRNLDRYGEGRFAIKVATRAGTERIARFSCELARKRKAKGLKLNYPEAVAVISAAALDGARAGKTIEEVTKEARSALTKADVMEGVADLTPMVQIEAVFTDGSRLVTVHSPIQ